MNKFHTTLWFWYNIHSTSFLVWWLKKSFLIFVLLDNITCSSVYLVPHYLHEFSQPLLLVNRLRVALGTKPPLKYLSLSLFQFELHLGRFEISIIESQSSCKPLRLFVTEHHAPAKRLCGYVGSTKEISQILIDLLVRDMQSKQHLHVHHRLWFTFLNI